MHRKKIAFAVAIATTVAMVFGTTSASASSALLKKESTGSEVTALQKDLKRLGYLSADATGYFGSATEDAVKKVQKEYGYDADGIAGNTTFSLVDRLLGRGTTSTDKSGSSTAVKTSTASINTASKLLKEGDENSSVKTLQKNLIKLGYLDTNATGFYGPATETAVKKLQKKYGYKADGIAGSATLALVSKLESGESVSTAAKTTAVKTTSVKTAAIETSVAKTTAVATAVTTAAAVETTDVKAAEAASSEEKDTPKITQTNFMPKWFGNVEKTFANGDTATVYDIESGLSFKIKRTYGHNHADCETLTTKDTATMKKIYSGAWSWERRAVIVSVDGLKIAASMSGLPHAGTDKYAANKTVSSRSGGYGRGTNLDAVKKNNMNGVFDIHFYGSKNHYNNKVDPKHQALIKTAAKWAEENYK